MKDRTRMAILRNTLQSLRIYVLTAAFAGCAVFVSIAPASAQDADRKFSIYSGADLAADSAELDVGYVPTPMDLVQAMFSLCSPGPDDFLIDMGSGDGRIIISAAKQFGTRGLGIDLNQKLIALSRKYALAEGVADRTQFLVQDLFLTDIRAADVVTMYLLPEVNLRLRPKLLTELKPGARIVSYNYHLGDWRPDKTLLFEKITAEGDDGILYFWVAPANVAGTWHWRLDLRGDRQEFTLELQQHYQDIGGIARNQGWKQPVFDATLSGDRIRFSLAGEADGRIIRQDYEGRVTVAGIEGSVKLSGATQEKKMKWRASRENPPGS